MTLTAGKITKIITIYVFVQILTILVSGSFRTVGAAGNSKLYRPVDEIFEKSDTASILSVLETRIDDRKILQKARNKLPTLGKEKLRLLTTLCERIKEGDTAESDIAFSLVTLLIILT